MIIAARLQIKGGSFRDLPLTTELSDSLEEWFAFLESVKGVRLRTGGIDFAGSTLVFPGRDGAPFSNKAFNARLKLACERARVPVISAHPLRHTAATLLSNYTRMLERSSKVATLSSQTVKFSLSCVVFGGLKLNRTPSCQVDVPPAARQEQLLASRSGSLFEQ